MCRIDERVYIRADGNRSRFQDTITCDKGRRSGKICSDAKVRTMEYHDPTSSPMPSSPLTPTYNTRTRRPSTASRPSTREGPVSLKPEIVIEFGAKKGKEPIISISTKKNHRSSMGSTSTFDSPDSEASHKVRTGYPEGPAPSLNSSYGGAHSRSGHYRDLSSDDSLTGRGRHAPAYHTSDDYDTPSLATGTTASSSATRPVIHHAPRHVPSPIETTRGLSGSPSNHYQTTVVTPRGVYDKTRDRTDRDQRTSSSYAPEITGRDEDRQRRRDEKRRQQEALDAQVAANLVQEENRRVHFEPTRAQHRADQRAEKTFGAHEQRRADERARQREQEKKEQEARAAKEAAAKRPKPSSSTSRPSIPSRRDSVRLTQAEAAEQQILIAAEAHQMQKERIKADALEREEQMQQQPSFQPPTLQQRQKDPGYYDPRGERPTIPQASVSRRNSLTGQTRPDLGRSNSKRGTGTGAPQPRQERRQPPVSYYNSNTRADLPPARERRPSLSHGIGPASPFAQPTTTADPWDVRNMEQALPNARGPQVGHNFPRPQQASHRMNNAFYPDSEDEYRRKK